MLSQLSIKLISCKNGGGLFIKKVPAEIYFCYQVCAMPPAVYTPGGINESVNVYFSREMYSVNMLVEMSMLLRPYQDYLIG